MSDHPARRRTVAVFCLLVGVALLATACGDDGRSSESAEAAPATAAPKAAASEAESDYCRNALEWQVHELVPFDESDPAATEEYFGDFVAFVDEATASAPGELADGWTLVSDTVHTVLVPILERYDYARPADPPRSGGRCGAHHCGPPGPATSIHTRRWSELGNGKSPTSRNSGSAAVGQNTSAAMILSGLEGST